jgi:tight adherence protein C
MDLTDIYAIAFGLSVCCVVLYVAWLYHDYVLEREILNVRGGQSRSLAFKVLRPFARFFGNWIAALSADLEIKRGRDAGHSYLLSTRVRVQKLLISAGRPEGLTADEFIGLVIFSVLAWTLVGTAIYALTGSGLPVPAGAVVGLFHPIFWLKDRVVRRRNEIRRLLPYALDLLTLSVEAGLDFTAALGRMLPKLGQSSLAQEFGAMLRDIQLGKPRSEALRDMADRVHMNEVNSFTAALIQADELGASIGVVLRIQADQMRNDRSNRAEKRAMEAPVKILFPLISCIFPTVFLIIFAPILIKYLPKILGS